MVALLLLALGGLAVWALREPPLPDPDFTLDGWRPDPAATLAQEQADRALVAQRAGDAATEAGRELVAAFEAFNAEEARAGGRIVDEGVRRAHTRIESAAERMLSVAGPDGYRALGLMQRARFTEALQATLAGARTAGLSLDAFAKQRTGSEAKAQADRLLGTALHEAVGAGLVTPMGELRPGAELVIPLLFTYRWMIWGGGMHPPERLLSAYERRTILAWKAWAHPALPDARRREVLGQLAELEPETPVHRILSVNAMNKGDFRTAAKEAVFAVLERPDDRTLRANLAYVTERLGRGE